MRWLAAYTLTLLLAVSIPAIQAQEPDASADSGSINMSTDSGIEGQVIIGPVCPEPTREEPACQARAYQATLTVLDQHGHVITSFQTHEFGAFRISLPPGQYTLQPAGAASSPYPFTKGQTVMVTAGEFTQVRVTYDTGMR
jgi:hypothetical protein